jgi:hypothetical protein
MLVILVGTTGRGNVGLGRAAAVDRGQAIW